MHHKEQLRVEFQTETEAICSGNVKRVGTKKFPLHWSQQRTGGCNALLTVTALHLMAISNNTQLDAQSGTVQLSNR